ncbi:hypothetical protein D5086_003849 [Populus alba]|uniref:Uncharacterized protein n=1 Tax=Populus alba TaxID=43335 RepID=A0ACC4D6C2_POPAL
MQRLKILGFIHCLSIEELPDEIGELKELRLLDVRGCRRLRRIPVNLIGRLKKLEELLIGGRSFEGWDVDGCDSTGGMNASLKELNSLSRLAVLSLRIPKNNLMLNGNSDTLLAFARDSKYSFDFYLFAAYKPFHKLHA